MMFRRDALRGCLPALIAVGAARAGTGTARPASAKQAAATPAKPVARR